MFPGPIPHGSLIRQALLSSCLNCNGSWPGFNIPFQALRIDTLLALCKQIRDSPEGCGNYSLLPYILFFYY